jgi:hypothetical protein
MPIIHGRMFPEVQSAGVLRREFRILIDPTTVTAATASNLVDIDVLRHYLRTLPGEPFRVSLLAPAAAPHETPTFDALCRACQVERVAYGAVIVPSAADALGRNAPTDWVRLISAATVADADFVVALAPSDMDLKQVSGKLHIAIGDWTATKKNCEIFVRGHDVPWAFSRPAWHYPWSTFYMLAEPDEILVGLWRRVASAFGPAGFDPDALERLRSLALNRHAALSYTRDKLLFYVQQQQAAKRHQLKRQDFAFEAGYFLNHYYVLLSAGLDQLCWIVNAVFSLGFTRSASDRRQVGTRNPQFIQRLREREPALFALYEDTEFIRWVKMLAAVRNFVAHEGFAMPSQLYIRSSVEPTDEELDREVEQTAEWQESAQVLPTPLLELARQTLRDEARLGRYRKIEERVMRIVIDGQEYFINPLLNIQWDFDNFFGFAHRVADLARTRL